MKTLSSTKKGVKYEDRLLAVEQALIKNPFVFIAGKTGVGKTSFMQSVWKKKYPALHIGEQALHQWATDKSPGLKVLFIDEANMANTHWSVFEGLFQNPPILLINNQFIKLTPEHKVLFAGNPQAYSADRQLPSFLERHGNSILFEPLPQKVLFQDLCALFPNQNSIQPLFDMMTFLEGCSTQEVLITPRELRAMALHTHAYCKAHPKASVPEVAYYYAHTMALPLVPKNYLDAFHQAYSKPPVLKHNHPKLKSLNLNANNKPAWCALSDLMQLRRLRQSDSDTYFGGINGLLVEGEPGLGKSELVIQTLIAQGLKKGNPIKDNSKKARFYSIPVSMPLTEKEALLRKAFDEGVVVVIDEINTGPSMERLLNALLQGKTPEGEDPIHPGFTLIVTQNPPTKAGRALYSNALKRRIHHTNIEPYTPKQALTILMNKGLEAETAHDMLEEYLILQKEAPDEWCFRDLLTRAQYEIEAGARCPKGATFNKKNVLLRPSIAKKLNELKQSSSNDPLLQDFIKNKKQELPSLKTVEGLQQFNKSIEDAYAILNSPQVKAVWSLIEEYQTKTDWWSLFAVKSASEKAAKMKAAFLKVPVGERHIVLSQKSPEAKEFCKILAEHRNRFSRFYYGDAVDPKTQFIRKDYAAEAFKSLSQTIEQTLAP